ncbi:UDP-N-acetylmuramate dehydrogenase [Motilibacter rhizosphaerae]|uniref:UDP-N-acetylenolpyruvoylglucosamine reductase n=1 Tax=Motilibacter rhizosphaerae TaxID=598652 RepID=A0A4Q7NA36_9ACTN|nr:UDP-N-acetylmuramate dehydrogenase [Motilibacter rhizosphaerae]RZS78983.1 UDP-N-acetylmuramate dehydrogenase [Motilibacter rhizosphaerae]
MSTLAELTTLGVGGPAGRLVRATTEAELLSAVQEADAAREPLLLVGGGSNLLVGDAGFPGTVVQVATRGAALVDCGCGYPTLDVAAGEPWESVVDRALEEGLAGIECLTGIPGTTGATPVQNVGAYGQEVAAVVERVRTWDRLTGQRRTLAVGDCGFGYRTSRFKQERLPEDWPGAEQGPAARQRWVVLGVELALRPAELSDPVRYAELARALGVPEGGRAPLARVRETVLALRARKGMVLDPADPDTRSAGSFFTNPVVPAAAAERVPADAPRWPAPEGRVKLSAAWLIQHAGFPPGYGDGPAALSGKHALALTNRGGARAEDLVALARTLRDRVADRFGVVLEPEPALVGVAL